MTASQHTTQQSRPATASKPRGGKTSPRSRTGRNPLSLGTRSRDRSATRPELADTTPARETTWQARAKALLERELAFIPNRRFARLPLQEAKQLEELDLSQFEGSGIRRDLPAHLARMCETPLLDEHQEQILFRRLNYLKYQANQLRAQIDPANPCHATVERAEHLGREAQRTLDLIVSANARLVISLVKRIKSHEMNFDDLLSDGLMAMIRAAEKFDESRGYRFSTYATMVVRRELYRSVQAAHRDHERFPSADQQWLYERAVDTAGPRLPDQQWSTMFHSLEQMLEELDPRERQIMHARFGFVEIGKKPSLQALADLFGVCKERVRQLERRALAKLYEMAQARGLFQYAEAYAD